jgi:hypothetical protein
MQLNIVLYLIICLLVSCTENSVSDPTAFNLTGFEVDGMEGDYTYTEVNLNPTIVLRFSTQVDSNSVREKITLRGPRSLQELNFKFDHLNNRVILQPAKSLEHITKYELTLPVDLLSHQQQPLNNQHKLTLYTQIDSTPKHEEISDDELLTKIQQHTFRYFWDFGHPVSGLARERNTSDEIVTSGGSGFGLMAIIVGIERGFITRQQGIERLTTIVDFLGNDAERFHGAWSHWLNGTTGEAIAFSTYDDGGDLVETSFMAMGLLTVKEYLDEGNTLEKELINKIDLLWKGVDWVWYSQGGQNVLYWHWSPNFQWQMNMPVRGYNEALITYLMAAASPTHPIDPIVYHEGWANNGGIINGSDYYDITLPVGYAFGGPLFFSHYSFMGLDPRNLSDQYANYWEQNTNHTLINRAYCIDNPKEYLGYSGACWGLTASDNHVGYSAHSPDNDRGVITPTAAISSIPYTPDYSMEAIKFFYYVLGDRLWGEYGFYDAFNLNEGWTANSYLAIDQGPIVVMIENYRTGLCWDLFMNNTDVQNGLTKLGFSY